MALCGTRLSEFYTREEPPPTPPPPRFSFGNIFLMRDIFRNQYIQRAPQGVALVC